MHGHDLPAVVLALGAAASFAVSNVTQMDAVSRNPRASGAGMLVRMVRDPLWMVGLVASVVGFALEATALSIAPVVLVQPLIVAELAFALPLAALVAGRRLGRTEWTGIGLVTAGLATVVAVIRPSDAPIVATGPVWALLFGTTATLALALVLAGRRLGTVGRTTVLAAAAGGTFGLLSVVTKATTHQFAEHGPAALSRWEPWALAGVGLVGMTLAQNAYRAGPLAVSLPLLDLGEPLCGSVIAILAFHEHLGDFGLPSAVLFAVALLLVVGGVAILDRSPLVRAADPHGGPERAAGGEAAEIAWKDGQSTAVTKSIRDSTAPTSDGSRSA